MTTVAWDGKELAADRRMVIGGCVYETTKIRRLSDGRLVGAAGCNAWNAVQVASRLDSETGNGIDVLGITPSDG